VAKKALRTALDAFFASLDEYTLADLVKPRRSLARLLELPAQ
jgi:Rrf2 family nitric oxide-sensitive transcriptional repressor